VASVSSVISITIAASVVGVERAALRVRAAVRSMNEAVEENEKVLDKSTAAVKAFAGVVTKLGAIGTVAPLVAGVTTSLVSLAPAAFVAVGAIGALVAAKATFKLATAGFADAVGGDADALAKLAPAARETVRAIDDLRPAFDELRRATQQEFFQGFADDLRLIADTHLPTLRRELPQIARQFNLMGREATKALTTPAAAEDIESILQSTTKTLGNMTGALGNVAAGILGIAGVGATHLPRLGSAIDDVAARFNQWVQESVENGELEAMIDRALEGFANLGTAATNIGRIIGAVFTGLSQGAGQDFLTTLAQITDTFADFVESPAIQEALGALGKVFTDIAAVVREVFLTALQELAPIVVELAPLISEIAEVVGAALVNALQIVGPLLRDFAAFLADNKEIIADLAPLVVGLWAAFKGYTIVTTAATALGPLVTRLGGLSRILRVGGLIVGLGAVAVEVDKINQAAARDEGRPLTDMEDNLADIVGGGRQIAELDFPGIFADIGDEITQLRTGFLEGTSPIGAFKDKFLELNLTVRDFFVDAGQRVIGFFTTDLPNAINGIADSIGTFFSTTLPDTFSNGLDATGDAVSTFFTTTLPNAVSDGVSVAFTAVTDFFTDLPRKVGFALGEVIGHVINFGQSVVDMFLNLPTRVGEIFDSFSDTVVDEAEEAGTDFLDTTTTWFDDTVAFLAELPGKAGTAIADFVTVAVQTATDAGSSFLAETQRLVDATIAFLAELPGRAQAAIADFVTVAVATAQDAMNGFFTSVVAIWTQVQIFLQSIPGRIQQAIGYLGNLLFNAGRDLIDGLGRGIRAAYQGLLDFVGGIADGIASVKGPLSYDKIVLVPHGEALMAGLEFGIRTGEERVLQYVAGTADRIASATQAGLGASGLGSAAQEALSRLNSGGSLFEDFTFRGQSANLGQFNDALVDRFKASGGGDVRAFLEAIVASEQRAAAPAVAGSPGADEPGIQVRVFIGQRELTDLVLEIVGAQDRTTAQRLRAGTGTTW
jgi:phage-related protein